MIHAASPTAATLAFAQQCLEQTSFAHRDRAVDYLRLNQPDLQPQIVARFATDPDPDVRYSVAQCLLDSEPERALDLLIDALATDHHEIYDAATLEICDYGMAVHIKRLRQLDAAAGGGSGYGRVADALQERIGDDD